MPEIPDPGYRAARIARVADFAAGVAGFLGQRQTNRRNEAAAFTNAEATRQFSMAKAHMEGAWSQFTDTLSGDPSTYTQQYQEFLEQTNEVIQPILQLPGAKDKYAIYWEEIGQSQQGTIASAAMEAQVARTQSDIQRNAFQYERDGNPVQLEEEIRNSIDAGIFTTDDWDNMGAEASLQRSTYNRAVNFVRAMPLDQGLATVRSEGFGEAMNLSPDQVERLNEDLTVRRQWRQEEADAQRRAFHEKQYNEYLDYIDDPGEEGLSWDRLRLYAVQVGDEYRPEVDRINTILKDQLDNRMERNQENAFNQVMIDLYGWDRARNPDTVPHSLEDLAIKRANDQISQEQYETATEAVRSLQGNEMSQNAGNVAAQMYSALSHGRDPRASVLDTELSELLNTPADQGGITENDFRMLSELRLSLGSNFEDMAERSAGNETTDAGEIAAARIVFDTSLMPDEKYDQLLPLLGNGLSVTDFRQAMNDVDEYSGRDAGERGTIMEAIGNYYSEAMRAEQDESDRMRLALEEARAKRSMQQVIADNPDDTTKWNEALNNLLSSRAERDLEDLIESTFDASFPFTWTTGAAQPLILETARERGMLQQYPQRAAEYERIRPEVVKQERDAITGIDSSIEIATVTPNGTANGDTVYIDRAGNYYVVFSRVVDEEFRNVPYVKRVGSDTWERLTRQQQGGPQPGRGSIYNPDRYR